MTNTTYNETTETTDEAGNGRMKRLVRSIITYIEESEVAAAGEYGGGEEWAEIKKGVADSNPCFDRHKEGVELHAEAESILSNGRMKRLVSFIFGEPIWTEDHDGEIRKRRMRRLFNGRVVFRAINAKVVGNADGSMVTGYYVVRWYPRDSIIG
jgi:hypothetical protein